MSEAIIVSHPEQAEHLYLLFHGVGSTPQAMQPLAGLIAENQPQAAVICICGPLPFDLSSSGFQWFSVRGVTEENREERVREAMPDFVSSIRSWQETFSVSPLQTTLIGFSQGAIMSIAAVQMMKNTLASRVFSLSGRFASATAQFPADVRLHILHGKQDAVIDWHQAQQSYEQLKELDANVTLDLFDDMDHWIGREEAIVLLNHLNKPVAGNTAAMAAADVRA